MTGQLDWPAETHARTDDLPTSLLAAQSMQGAARPIAIQVLFDLQKRGPATFSQIASRTRMSPGQVWRRISDLKRWNLIEDTGLTAKGPSGRSQTVWAAK